MLRRAAVLLLAMVALLAGCTDDGEHVAPQDTDPAPSLGGPTPPRHALPTGAMDGLERPVADLLSHKIAAEGLHLDYLDCPPWNRTVPSRMTCRGYVDGLVARVKVLVTAATAGRDVRFDAWLGSGMVVTRALEDTVRSRGWVDVDCGSVPAYPARIGTRIVCRGERAGQRTYLVATVRSHAGTVVITGYPGSSPAR